MVVRGIISPIRSRSSPRERKPYNPKNTPFNPPAKPNYLSPHRRPIDNHPNELQRSNRKETQPTLHKPTAVRPTKQHNHDDRPSVHTSRKNPSKPTSKIVSSRPQAATPSPDGNKKLVNNSTTKISTRPSASSKPSSPGTTKPISQQTRPMNSPRIGTVSGSRSDLPSAAKPSAVGKDKYFDSRKGSPSQLDSYGSGHQNPHYSAGQHNLFNPLHDLLINEQLKRFSLDGKDLASILNHANSICESLGSDITKEESSSESNDSRMLQIYKEIGSHRQENSSIASYLTKLQALWDELATFNTDLPKCLCGGAIEKLSKHMEREKVMQFLVGLNDSYSTICNQMLLTTQFLTVEKAYTALIREEKRRELLVALETVAEKVIQNNWLDLQNQNAHSTDGANSNGVQELVDINNQEHQVDQNQVTSLPIEPSLIDLGSPVRC